MRLAEDPSAFSERDPEPERERDAVVYVRCPVCGRPVRLPPPESGERARCEGCGALVDSAPGP